VTRFPPTGYVCPPSQTHLLARRIARPNATATLLGCSQTEALDDRPAEVGKEARMELKMSLSVLAAIMSFAFLAAIVFGMV
jgi:hypothetical protein